MRSITQLCHLPAICVLCEQYLAKKQGPICEACMNLLTPLPPGCQYCAYPLPSGATCCGECLTKRPQVDVVLTAYQFEEPLRTLLHWFKYHNGLFLLNFFVELMLSAQPSPYKTDCIIPVPLHPRRLRQRGFNQAALLAQRVAQIQHIPYLMTACQKINNTPPQAHLSATERQRNLRNAFVAQAVPHTHVTLVDDLYTTGSTANELARILKHAGISRVDLWCPARAV